MAIANVGGQSGLWLGCSVITIIQVIYYVVLASVQYFQSSKNEMGIKYVSEKKKGNNVKSNHGLFKRQSI